MNCPYCNRTIEIDDYWECRQNTPHDYDCDCGQRFYWQWYADVVIQVVEPPDTAKGGA